MDALKVDTQYKIQNWGKCVVKSIGENGRLRLAFKNDGDDCDREVSANSTEIAPLESKTAGDDEWRSGLAVGDKIDCYDTTSLWYASTVIGLDTRELQGKKLPHVNIAFRVSHPQGDKKDKGGDTFFGWDESFDEWLPLYNVGIQKY
jgi:hypothetical protein